MLKIIKRWWYYWNLSRQAKKNLREQIRRSKSAGPHEPPTPEEVEKFKKEFDMGWDSHMITRVEPRRTYYEAEI